MINIGKRKNCLTNPLQKEGDIPEEIREMGGSIQNKVEKDFRRAKRRSEKIPSRFRCLGDYCGATFHVSVRNQGRKPKYKDHRRNANLMVY